ncbi:substrate-binding domain-containing protein [Pantoea sp. PGP6]
MRVLAAGSLKRVWPALMAHFPQPADTLFGPAGLLRECIEAGEPCDLFASANRAHPETLLHRGRALSVIPFASNMLCLTIRSDVLHPGDDWHTLLTRGDLRIATSTPGADPSGDYTQRLFTQMGDAGEAVRQRAMALVGGRDTPPVPHGRLAAEWLILEGKADLFIGYSSYRTALGQIAGLRVIDIPVVFNPQAEYVCAVITPQAEPLAAFLASPLAQSVLRDAGFGC